MAEIKVPKPPKAAFNPNRPASGLLRDQVEHLEWAVRHAGQRSKQGRRAYVVKKVRTEADVAARMAALLPKLASADRLPPTSVALPATPESTPPRKRRAATKKRKPARRPARRVRKKARAKR
jgi:hypothetical protein